MPDSDWEDGAAQNEKTKEKFIHRYQTAWLAGERY